MSESEQPVEKKKAPESEPPVDWERVARLDAAHSRNTAARRDAGRAESYRRTERALARLRFGTSPPTEEWSGPLLPPR
jgi:hypothetical protein